jgi:hypothetical protein
MNYLLISDIIWYGGHILTGISILFTQNNFYVAVSLVAIGQFITMISRPIGRITNDEMKDNNLDFV